jgi:hypothetical protein
MTCYGTAWHNTNVYHDMCRIVYNIMAHHAIMQYQGTPWQVTVHHSTPLPATQMHTTKYGTKQLINYHALHVQQGMSRHCTDWHNTCIIAFAHHGMHSKVMLNRVHH